MNKEDRRIYMQERRFRIKNQMLELLGNVCVECKTTQNLEFDHIDPSTKDFEISGRGLDKSINLILAEVKKCQLLCKDHHIEKTRQEVFVKSLPHGTGLTGKRNCHCELCGPLKKKYQQEWKRKKQSSI